jgi:hypothetical protein
MLGNEEISSYLFMRVITPVVLPSPLSPLISGPSFLTLHCVCGVMYDPHPPPLVATEYVDDMMQRSFLTPRYAQVKVIIDSILECIMQVRGQYV